MATPSVDLDQWAGDFVGFAAKLDILPRDGPRQKLRPNAIQSAFEVSRTGWDIVLKPRQVGLTTWELARDIHHFLTKRGAHVVVVVQSMSDDAAINEIADKVRVMLDSLAAELGLAFPVKAATATKWVLPERDARLRIIGAGASEAAAKKKGRSGSITRLHVTEAAFFEFATHTLNALLPSVSQSPGTEVIIESTANGAAGPFHQRYQDAKKGKGRFKAHFFPWINEASYRAPLEPNESIFPETDTERELVAKHGATAEQLKWYRLKVVDQGQDLADQEFPIDEERAWLTAGRLFFDKKRTQALLTTTKEPIETTAVGRAGSGGTLRLWKLPEAGHEYVLGGDPSGGEGGDPAAAALYDRYTGEHVGTLYGQFTPWEFGRVLVEIANRFNHAWIAVERQNHGRSVLDWLTLHRKYRNVWCDRDEKPGWNNSESSRSSVLDKLHDAHREARWTSPCRASIAEMLVFVVNKHGKPEATSGAHDDLVISHAIAWHVISTPLVDRRRHELNDYDEETDDA